MKHDPRKSYFGASAAFGAPRSMKMGTIHSPCRYEVGAYLTTGQLKLRRPTLVHFNVMRIVKIIEKRLLHSSAAVMPSLGALARGMCSTPTSG